MGIGMNVGRSVDLPDRNVSVFEHRNCFVESDRATKQLLAQVFGVTTG